MARSSNTAQVKLDGKTVIITGGNTGIGLETAVDLAKRNARVILACRSVERGETAAVEVRKRSGNDNAVFFQLDLASLDSVRKFAANILEEEPRIDILINNAGVINSTYRESENGYESTFAVNHLGHFLLTNLLLDRLKVAPSARIVNVGALLYKLHKEYKFDEIKLIAKTLPDSVVSPTGLTFKASLPMYYSPWGYISVLRAPM